MEYEYVLEDESYPHNAIPFESAWTPGNPDCLAADAGEHYYDDDPDPEEFPLKLEIFDGGKSVGMFEVFLDFSPDFTGIGR